MNGYRVFAKFGDMTTWAQAGFFSTKRAAIAEAKSIMKRGHKAAKVERLGVLVVAFSV